MEDTDKGYWAMYDCQVTIGFVLTKEDIDNMNELEALGVSYE